MNTGIKTGVLFFFFLTRRLSFQMGPDFTCSKPFMLGNRRLLFIIFQKTETDFWTSDK